MFFLKNQIHVLLLLEEILHQLRLVVYPHYLQGFIHPNGGCLGFLNHQQYHLLTSPTWTWCQASCHGVWDCQIDLNLDWHHWGSEFRIWQKITASRSGFDLVVLTNPCEKYAQVKLDHETPRVGGENEKCFKPPPSDSLPFSTNNSLSCQKVLLICIVRYLSHHRCALPSKSPRQDRLKVRKVLHKSITSARSESCQWQLLSRRSVFVCFAFFPRWLGPGQTAEIWQKNQVKWCKMVEASELCWFISLLELLKGHTCPSRFDFFPLFAEVPDVTRLLQGQLRRPRGDG